MTFCTLPMVWRGQGYRFGGLKRLSAFMTFCTKISNRGRGLLVRLSQTPFGFHDVLYYKHSSIFVSPFTKSQTPFGFHDVLYANLFSWIFQSKIGSQTPFGFHDVLYKMGRYYSGDIEGKSQTPFGFHDVLYVYVTLGKDMNIIGLKRLSAFMTFCTVPHISH